MLAQHDSSHYNAKSYHVWIQITYPDKIISSPDYIHCPTSWHKNVISWQKMPQMVWSHMISYIYIKMSSTDHTVPYNVRWWHYNATSWHKNDISWQKTPQCDVILPYPDLTMLYSHNNFPDSDIIMPHPSSMRPHCVIRLPCRLLVL